MQSGCSSPALAGVCTRLARPVLYLSRAIPRAPPRGRTTRQNAGRAGTGAKMRADGQTVDAIAEALKVSTATARRFISNLDLAHAVEAGAHDKSWKPGTREVIVHVVASKPIKA